MDPSDETPDTSTEDVFAPSSFMPIDQTGGTQAVLSGLTPLVPGVLVAQRYRLVKPAGRIGNASRWEATDESLSRAVMVLAFPNDRNAPRILEAARQASGAMDARFLRILDAGQDADGAYIVSEWTQGRTLTELITQNPLSSLESAWITHEIAAGLDSVHPLRLYHLRLNPSDILITTNGSVKITGLMVEAALTEEKDDQNLTRLDMEKLDVLGCGQILYACLTSTWPGSPIPGMPQAQRTDAGLPTPIQVRPGTSVELNKVTYQIMSPSSPVHLTTAKDIVDVLGQSLGNTTGTVELARRASAAPEPPFPSEHGAATRPVILPAGSVPTPRPAPEGSDSVNVQTEPLGDTTADTAATAALGSTSAESTSEDTPVSGGEENFGQPPREVTQKQVRRWSIGLIFLICALVVAIITTLIVVAYKNSQVPPAPPLVERPVSQAIVFDPKADGGNATENEDKTYLAFDGDLATVWPTADYNPGYITTLKPGVGLIFDLGEPVSVSQISVATTILPTTIQFYLPPDTTAAPDHLPMDTIKSWQALMVTPPTSPTASPDTSAPSYTQSLAIPQGGSPVTVTIAPTTTRYILVYITQLQPGEDKKDHGNLAEVTFSGI